MKKTIAFLTVAFMLIFNFSVLPNGLSLNSIGTKALGMGGAFVGLANDGTALYWNPAGLAGQNSSILVFGTDVIPFGSYKYSAAGIDAKTVTNHYISPNLFFNYKMENLALSFGVFVPAGLGAEWNGKDVLPLTGGMGPFNWLSKIGVINFSPGIAYQITPQFSVGAALNIYYATFDLKRPHNQVLDLNQDGIPETLPQYSENSTGTGYGVTIGLKYTVSKKISFGATFRTSTKVTMSGTGELLDLPAQMKSDFDRNVTWPMWIAGGIAYHPAKYFTLTLDAQYSNWKALDKLTAKYKQWATESDFSLNWKDATQIRLGAEYAPCGNYAVRFGYYYDPAPAPDETLNFLFPSSTNHVITGGFSYFMDKVTLEGALEYLIGAERDVKAYPDPLAPENMPGIHKLDVLAFSIGITYNL